MGGIQNGHQFITSYVLNVTRSASHGKHARSPIFYNLETYKLEKYRINHHHEEEMVKDFQSKTRLTDTPYMTTSRKKGP